MAAGLDGDLRRVGAPAPPDRVVRPGVWACFPRPFDIEEIKLFESVADSLAAAYTPSRRGSRPRREGRPPGGDWSPLSRWRRRGPDETGPRGSRGGEGPGQARRRGLPTPHPRGRRRRNRIRLVYFITGGGGRREGRADVAGLLRPGRRGRPPGQHPPHRPPRRHPGGVGAGPRRDPPGRPGAGRQRVGLPDGGRPGGRGGGPRGSSSNWTSRRTP